MSLFGGIERRARKGAGNLGLQQFHLAHVFLLIAWFARPRPRQAAVALGKGLYRQFNSLAMVGC